MICKYIEQTHTTQLAQLSPPYNRILKQLNSSRMSKFAILGGTGSTGSAIITQLLGSQHILHIYARSEDRLLDTIPQLNDTDRVKLFIGSLDDADNLADCLDGVSAIFSAVASNTSEPNISIARDTAKAVVTALERHKHRAESKGESFKCPTLLFLASASTSRTHIKGEPWLARTIVWQCLYHIYHDLELAQAYLSAPEQDWLPHVVICPGALTKGEAVGHYLSVEPAKEPMLTYDDLAAGMIEIANDPERWEGKEVSVAGKRAPVSPEVRVLAGYLVTGFLCTWVRPLWRVGRWLRAW